eukprot:6194747-Pleurochrysis_carterae.AAC.2
MEKTAATQRRADCAAQRSCVALCAYVRCAGKLHTCQRPKTKVPILGKSQAKDGATRHDMKQHHSR